MSAEDTSGWEGKSFAFFQNRDCECFPCHPCADRSDFSCLFCYCPLYALGADCGGAFTYTEKGIKDCSGCLFPHRRENYGAVLEKMREVIRRTSKTQEDEPGSPSGRA